MVTRIMSILIVEIVVAGLFTGCSGDGTTTDLTAVEVAELIQQAASLEDMKQGDQEKLRKLYRLEAEKVEDFVLYTATSNVRADELAIIKVTDVNDIAYILAHIQQRIEAQTVKFQDYRPEEYNLIEKHVLKTKGRYILFAVSDKADHIEEAFDEALK